MPTQNANQRANPNVTPATGRSPVLRGRPTAVGTAVVFRMSSALPVVAGLSKNTASFPIIWWGMLDVGLAFVVAILVFGLMLIAQGKVDRQAVNASYRAYRILNHSILVMLFFVFSRPDRLDKLSDRGAWWAWLMECLPCLVYWLIII